MKLVLYCYTSNQNEFIRIIEIVKNTAIEVVQLDTSNVENKTQQIQQIQTNYFDNKYIVFDHHKSKHDHKVYVFDRFNENFIKAVEHAIDTNPFKHVPGINWEGQFIVQNIDDRFTDPKYYNIEVRKRGSFNTSINAFGEYLQINKDKIIDDLYNHILPH
jgi:hypothetical protein